MCVARRRRAARRGRSLCWVGMGCWVCLMLCRVCLMHRLLHPLGLAHHLNSVRSTTMVATAGHLGRVVRLHPAEVGRWWLPSSGGGAAGVGCTWALGIHRLLLGISLRLLLGILLLLGVHRLLLLGVHWLLLLGVPLLLPVPLRLPMSLVLPWPLHGHTRCAALARDAAQLMAPCTHSSRDHGLWYCGFAAIIVFWYSISAWCWEL